MNNELKDRIDLLYKLCDILDQGPYGAKALGTDQSLKEIVKFELNMFLMYLSASDDSISWLETDFMKEYLDWDLNADFTYSYLKENNIYSTQFESRVPFSVKIFVRADQASMNLDCARESLGCELLYWVYEQLGKEFLECDYDVSDSEREDLSIYLWTLRNYIDKEIKENPCYGSPTNQVVIEEIKNSETENEESLESLLQELNELTGLEDVKKDVKSLINLLQIRKIRQERGMKQISISLHLVFSGNPGTGKTTVARLLAKIYRKLGVLSKGHLLEVDRSGLVGGYVGQTAIKVQEVIQKALGGILFIDEAYSLTANKGENDYGIEAVDTLLKGMEDHREDLVVIVAGYPDLMNEFLNSNPGLRSRFNKFINFSDYNPEELVEIFRNMCEKSGYYASEQCMNYVKKYFEKRYITRNVNFANGRDVRNFFEMAMVNQANRLSTDTDITNADLAEFTLEDVENIAV